MFSNQIRVFLGINYNTVPGEDASVVGNISELGNWNPDNSFPLNYHQGGNWSNALELEPTDTNIEYKYIIKNNMNGEIRWEEGENRILNLKDVKSSRTEVFNLESWNHREVNIRLKYDCSSKKSDGYMWRRLCTWKLEKSDQDDFSEQEGSCDWRTSHILGEEVLCAS